MSGKTKAWIKAFRLRTLPLAFSCIGMGSFLAAAAGAFRWEVFGLCVLTTLFLQILSNLANDYGDSVSGVDGEHRSGPSRTVQDGLITRQEMKKSLYLFSVLSFVSGIALLVVALGSNWQIIAAFVLIGLAAIYAAIKYTSGKNPYGYVGLGDLSVFIFFGLVGVSGAFFLYTLSFNPSILLPASTCGLFAVAVLNLNNIRDIKSDEIAGKRSIPVRLGRERAIYYHWFLLITGFLLSVVYVYLNYKSPIQFAILLILPLLFVNGKAVLTKKEAMALDPYLKQMAISTLLFVIIFGLSNTLI
ncbi:MAG: 1,4-dihydroxy-2-naphthoate polyprenyltransferase [bacterium]|nr:1,4-dihydroxy-2-naphthoate polyprenyltransferase [bacterium]